MCVETDGVLSAHELTLMTWFGAKLVVPASNLLPSFNVPEYVTSHESPA